jgi:MFS family permease
LLLGTSFAAGLAILTVPETSAGHPNVLASLRPSVGIPRQARTTFARTAPIFGAAWAVNGFYLSLGPSLAGEVFRSRNLLWGGLVIFLLTALAGIASVVARAWPARATMMVGCIALFAGAAITFAAVARTSAGVFLAGIAIAGIGVGIAFLGSFRVLSALATPGQRASLISAIFIEAYTAFSVPVVIAGIATSRFGLHGTGLAYCAAVAVLAALALVSLLRQGRAATGTRAPVSRMDRPIINSSDCGV